MQKKERVFNEELTDIVRKRFSEGDMKLILAIICKSDFIETSMGMIDESVFVESLSETMLNALLACMALDEENDLCDSVMDCMFCSIDFSTLAKEHLSEMYRSILL